VSRADANATAGNHALLRNDVAGRLNDWNRTREMRTVSDVVRLVAIAITSTRRASWPALTEETMKSCLRKILDKPGANDRRRGPDCDGAWNRRLLNIPQKANCKFTLSNVSFLMRLPLGYRGHNRNTL
jgi:hypothetical protein